MTIDEALSKARTKIDRILEQRRDEMMLKMIADGSDPAEQLPPPSPEDGAWSRVSVEWVLKEQRARDEAWRDQVLVDVRGWLEEEYGKPSGQAE